MKRKMRKYGFIRMTALLLVAVLCLQSTARPVSAQEPADVREEITGEGADGVTDGQEDTVDDQEGGTTGAGEEHSGDGTGENDPDAAGNGEITDQQDENTDDGTVTDDPSADENAEDGETTDENVTEEAETEEEEEIIVSSDSMMTLTEGEYTMNGYYAVPNNATSVTDYIESLRSYDGTGTRTWSSFTADYVVVLYASSYNLDKQIEKLELAKELGASVGIVVVLDNRTPETDQTTYSTLSAKYPEVFFAAKTDTVTYSNYNETYSADIRKMAEDIGYPVSGTGEYYNYTSIIVKPQSELLYGVAVFGYPIGTSYSVDLSYTFHYAPYRAIISLEGIDPFTVGMLPVTEGCYRVGISGTYYNSKTKDAILKELNRIRKEACDEGVPDPRKGHEGERLKASDYIPLKWSSSLERIVNYRAVETAVGANVLGHNSLNGKSIYNGIYPAVESIQSNGENLAWNWSSDAMQGIQQFYNEKADWVNQAKGKVTGHYTNIIDPDLRYVGVSVFGKDSGGWRATAYQASRSEAEEYDETQIQLNGHTVVPIDVKKEYCSGFKITGKNAVEVEKDNSLQLNVEVTISGDVIPTPEKGVLLDGVDWSSDDESVAKVDSRGIVTGVGYGSTTVRATVEGTELTKIVNVNLHLGSIGLDKNTVTLVRDDVATDTEILSVIYYPEDTTDSKVVTWTSSDSKTVKVEPIKEEEGDVIYRKAKITALKATPDGKPVTIKAQVGNHTATCKVTVRVPMTGISLNQDHIEVATGKTSTLKVGFEPADTNDDKTVTWTSSDESIATVSAKGVVKGISNGDAVITATVGTFTASCNVTVVTPATGIAIGATAIRVADPADPDAQDETRTITKKKLTAYYGDTIELSAVLTPGTATSAVTWSSNKVSFATVAPKVTDDTIDPVTVDDRTGVVTAAESRYALPVTVRITAASAGKSAYVDITFRVKEGWFDDGDGNTLYIGANGKAVTGFQNIGGGENWYYFDAEGHLQTGNRVISKKRYLITEDKEDPGKHARVLIPTAEAYAESVFTDLPVLDGDGNVTGTETYYILRETDKKGVLKKPGGSKTGVVQTGLKTVGGEKYYFDTSTGVMLKNARIKIGKVWYTFGPDGKAQTEALTFTGKNAAGEDITVTVTGNAKSKALGKYTFTDADGKAKNYTGLITDEDGKYYYIKNGAMQVGLVSVSLTVTDSATGADVKVTKKCFFDRATGEMRSGYVQDGKKAYYLDDEVLPGIWCLATGEKTEDLSASYGDGAVRYFKNGVQATGLVKVYDGKVLKGLYYFDKTSGNRMTGWIKVGSAWYLLTEDGSLPQNGTYDLINSQSGSTSIYCVFKNGALTAAYAEYVEGNAKASVKLGAKAAIEMTTADGRVMLFKGGKPLTGWQKVNGMYQYYHTLTGIKQSGWITVGKAVYYAVPADGTNPGGRLQNSWLQETVKDGDGNETHRYYYFDKNGRMVTGRKKLSCNPYMSNYVPDAKKQAQYYYYFSKTDGHMLRSTVTNLTKSNADENGVNR